MAIWNTSFLCMDATGNGKQKLKKKCTIITEKSVCESSSGKKCNWINNNNENVLFVKAVDNNNKNATDNTHNSYTYGLPMLLMLFILCYCNGRRTQMKNVDQMH